MRKDSQSVRPHHPAVQQAAAIGVPGQLLASGVQLQQSGLLFTANQSLSKWEQLGTKLFSFADSSTWWIADWLVYGESTFHDRYQEAIKRTSLSYQTLRNYTWVARRFPLPRRRQGVSFSHHLEVVALEQPEQDYWLRKAEDLGWSRNKLRGEVRSSLNTRQCELAGTDTAICAEAGGIDAAAAATQTLLSAGSASDARLLNLQLSAEDLAKIERTAGKDSESIETWAAKVLRRAVADA